MTNPSTDPAVRTHPFVRRPASARLGVVGEYDPAEGKNVMQEDNTTTPRNPCSLYIPAGHNRNGRGAFVNGRAFGARSVDARR